MWQLLKIGTSQNWFNKCWCVKSLAIYLSFSIFCYIQYLINGDVLCVGRYIYSFFSFEKYLALIFFLSFFACTPLLISLSLPTSLLSSFLFFFCNSLLLSAVFLSFLLNVHSRYIGSKMAEDALEMVLSTLRAMAHGGIHDHVGQVQQLKILHHFHVYAMYVI